MSLFEIFSQEELLQFIENYTKDISDKPTKLLNGLFIESIKQNNIQVFELLLKDSRIDPDHAIVFASENGRVEIVKILLQDPRVDPSTGHNCPIQKASLFGHTDIVKILLEDERVDPSDKGNFAIELASDNCHIEIVKLLLTDRRVNPSDDNDLANNFLSACDHDSIYSYMNHLKIIKMKEGKPDSIKRENGQIHLIYNI